MNALKFSKLLAVEFDISQCNLRCYIVQQHRREDRLVGGNKAKKCTFENLGSMPSRGKVFSLLKHPRLALGPKQPSIQ